MEEALKVLDEEFSLERRPRAVLSFFETSASRKRKIKNESKPY